MTIPTVFSSAEAIGAAIGDGSFTSQQFVQLMWDWTTAKDTFNALAVRVPLAQQLTLAAAADGRAAATRAGTGTRLSQFDGVPFTLKMPLRTLGVQTANNDGTINLGSPTANSDIAQKMEDAGFILAGKTNGPGSSPYRCRTTFSVPASGTPRAPFETKNPRNPLYATGGSSGGSAAAVACGFSPVDIGTDSAGSGRIPPAYCGVIGFKPTNGAVSGEGDWGANAMPSRPPMHMLDVWSYCPITRYLADARAIYQILAGPTFMRPCAPPFIPSTGPTLQKIVSVRQIGPWYCNPYVQNAIDALLALQTATVQQTTIPWYDEATLGNLYNGLYNDPAATAMTYAGSESSFYYGMLNWTPVSSRNPQAKAAQTWLTELVGGANKNVPAKDGLFNGADFLIMGTVALLPPKITDPDPSATPYMAMTSLFNITRHPCLTIPIGFDAATGIGIGVQVVGRLWHDDELLDLANQLNGLPGFVPPSI